MVANNIGIQVGARVGAYELRGATPGSDDAEVFLARHRMLDTKHAFRILRSGRSEAMAVAMVEGARVQVVVSHPNVVRVTDCGMSEQRPFIVSDWVEGRTLSDWLDRYGGFPSLGAVRLFRGIVRGLAAIHDVRIAHRNLTPSNILVDKKLAPRITGFRRARRIDKGSGAPEQAQGASAAYTAPELAGDTGCVDVRSDFWSLGVMLYEVVTKELPFSGDAFAGFRSMADRRPDLDVPPALDEVVQELLQVDPALRLASARDVLSRLDAL